LVGALRRGRWRLSDRAKARRKSLPIHMRDRLRKALTGGWLFHAAGAGTT
jgi:hypothetical protein